MTHYFFSLQNRRPLAAAPLFCFMDPSFHERAVVDNSSPHTTPRLLCTPPPAVNYLCLSCTIYPTMVKMQQGTLNGNSHLLSIFLDHVILMCYYHHLWFHLTSLLLYSVPLADKALAHTHLRTTHSHTHTHTDRLGTAALGQYWLLWKTLWRVSRTISSVHGSSPCMCFSAWKASL